MSIIKDSAYLVASNVILVFCSLATGVMTARWLGPEGRGELYLLIQIASLGALVISCGLGPSYQYHLTKGFFSRSQILSHLLTQIFFTFLLVFFVCFYAGDLWTWLAGTEVSEPLRLIASLALISNVAISFSSCVMMSMNDGIKLNSFLGVLSALINLFGLVILVWGLEWGVYGAILAYFLSIFIRLLPTIVKVMSGIWLQVRFKWIEPSTKLFGYGFSAFLSNIMVSTVFRIDVFILSAISGVASVGIYSVSVAFAELALMVPNAVGMSLFAHLPRMNLEEQISVIQRSSVIVFLIAVISGLGLIIFSYPIVLILMGDEYLDAVIPLCLLVPGVISMSVNYVFSNFYSAIGKPIVGVYCFALGLVANVFLCYFLIPIYGVSGAALASTLAYFVITFSFLFLLKHQFNISVIRMFKIDKNDIQIVKEKIRGLISRFLPQKG